MNSAFKSHLGEVVRYTPAGGQSRTITAVVDREPLAPQGERLEHQVELYVDMADVNEVNEGGDYVQIKRRQTDADFTTFKVTRIISQAGANWQLGLG